MSGTSRSIRWAFFLALVALCAAEALRVYWIMPFPGSQTGETIGWAYGLHRSIWIVRILCGGVALWAGAKLLASGRWGARIGVPTGAIVYGLLAWQANGPMSADTMFRQPERLRFAAVAESSLQPEALIVGVALADAAGAIEATAYPVRYIGYHHQVRDVVAGRPIMVTYCTVCRTGRVYSPVVDGAVEEFRLVGMDHWNAMFEDSKTGSWWRQANGEAVAGPLRGRALNEIPSRQMTWAAWSSLHPASRVMEADPAFAEQYAHMDGFEEGTRASRLTGRDPGSWQEKSWVVGILAGDAARAFDWNELVERRVIADRVGEIPILLTLGSDGASFHAFDARPPGADQALDLEPSGESGIYRDRSTGSRWSAQGLALDGDLAGTRLAPLRAYQEFWHSWRTFRPESSARR